MLKTKIIEAAEAGLFTLAHIEDGADFDSVAEWLEFEPSESDMEAALLRAGLITTGDLSGGDIYEINERLARERARNAGLI